MYDFALGEEYLRLVVPRERAERAADMQRIRRAKRLRAKTKTKHEPGAVPSALREKNVPLFGWM